MKTYTITVNGTAYDVTVEEKAGGAGGLGGFFPVQAVEEGGKESARQSAPACRFLDLGEISGVQEKLHLVLLESAHSNPRNPRAYATGLFWGILLWGDC